MAIELLQQVGLNKYEAEAYYTLLIEGPLTGYELGKRSNVPLSRSYEILHRLTQKGLAVAQPGEPPRYAAEDPEHVIERVRQAHTATLTALTAALDGLPQARAPDEFWVRRGRQHILAHAQAMLAQAERTVDLRCPSTVVGEVVAGLEQARLRGCQVLASPGLAAAETDADLLLLLVDGRHALAGMLTPADGCQAVASTNPALIAAIRSYFTRQFPRQTTAPALSTLTAQGRDRMEALRWEEWKHRRLIGRDGEDDAA
jgi:HTH-type transcriptional regulator, sugar sensing transcriptional regulator